MAATLTPVLHLVTCGSVDDGKSTLIGRLLAETANFWESAWLRRSIEKLAR